MWEAVCVGRRGGAEAEFIVREGGHRGTRRGPRTAGGGQRWPHGCQKASASQRTPADGIQHSAKHGDYARCCGFLTCSVSLYGRCQC